MRNKVIIIFVFIVGLVLNMYSQPASTAVPFLLNSASAGSNGMGEAGIALRGDDPFALFWNPSQLGIQSLTKYGGIGFSSSSAYSLEDQEDLTNTTQVYSAGVNISKYIPLPVDLSFGIAYSRMYEDLGTFVMTSQDPTPLGTFNADETSKQVSVGVGVDGGWYYGGLGFTHKDITSNLAPFNVQGQGRQGVATVGAVDEGLLIGVRALDALAGAINHDLTLFTGVKPNLDISFGYTRANFGDNVTYIDAEQSDPLPRTVREGVGIDLGVTYKNEFMEWKPVTLKWALDASDGLVNRWNAVVDSNYQVVREAGWEYRSSSDINFFNDVVLGNGNNKIEKRKGWEVSLLEFFYYRGGRIENPEGKHDVTTNGFGFRLNGVFKAINYLSAGAVGSPALQWIFDHVDFTYNHSSNDSNVPFESKRTFNDYLISVRN